jgi:hypothetical protein
MLSALMSAYVETQFEIINALNISCPGAFGLFYTHEEHLVARAEPRRWDARGAPHDKGACQFGR